MFIVNVEGAIFRDNKWLIIERSKKEQHAGGLLSLVGDKVEPEEVTSDILEKTVIREIFEEVDIKVKKRLTYVHSTSFNTDLGKNVVIGTHGNIMVLIMNYFDRKYGFPLWQNLEMPDIYKLSFTNKNLINVNGLWK